VSVLSLTLILALAVSFERPAWAYVDPGSGFVFLQVIGSMAAGALFYLRHKIKGLFGFGQKLEEDISSTAEAGETEPQA
jgi:hypothetical protein